MTFINTRANLAAMSHHLCGVAEIARLLGVSRQRVDQLVRAYPDFPKPEAELAAGRIWSTANVEGWLATHPERAPGRVGGRPISFDRLTDRARQAFVLAQNEAQGLGHHYVGPEHLVLGLGEESEGRAGQALRAAGLNVHEARTAISRLVPLGPSSQDRSQGRLPFSPSVDRALREAEATADELGHSYLGTEHVLLGILRDEGSPGSRLLVEARVDPQLVRLKLLETMAGPRSHDGPEPWSQATEQGRRLVQIVGQLTGIEARLGELERRLT